MAVRFKIRKSGLSSLSILAGNGGEAGTFAKMRTFVFFFTALLLISFMPKGVDRAAADGPLALKVKAAYLFHFTQFVDWPAEDLGDQNRPIRICILGKDPFGSLLNVLEKKRSQRRELIVERVTVSRRLAHCHLVFISASEEGQLNEVLRDLKTASVLTVGDMKSFARRGGIIAFVMEGNKVRLEINRHAAERAGLKISAKLLEIATIVR